MSSEIHTYQRLRTAARSQIGAAAQLALQIAAIPAPTGAEHERARFVANLLEQRGYRAEIDGLANVFTRRGAHGGRALLVAAHIDTVFPAAVPINVNRNGDVLRGPGVGDNSLGVAAMITAIDILDEMKLCTEADILFTANVGEEGLGNLRGIRAVVERHMSDIGAGIAVEGHNLGRITNVGVGSKRWRIVAHGPGGHSWGAFGQPSAVHGLARVISKIAEIQVPRNPRTTFNVGMIEGGTSINTIAPEATCLVDMRSTSEQALDRLAAEVRSIVDEYSNGGLRLDIEVLGERPAGSTDRTNPLVEAALDTLRWLNIDTVFDASSTDANMLMSVGVPAICIGVSRGSRGHTVDECIQVPPIEMGLAQFARLCVDVPALIAAEKL